MMVTSPVMQSTPILIIIEHSSRLFAYRSSTTADYMHDAVSPAISIAPAAAAAAA
jgi:hypothetical protein